MNPKQEKNHMTTATAANPATTGTSRAPGYAYPEALVSTDWVKENLGKPGIKLVEIDVDTKAYDAGHLPGSIGFNWQTQLQDQVKRDIIGKEAFEKLVGGAGVSAK